MVAALTPVKDPDLGTKFEFQRISTGAGAVGKPDLGNAGVDERSDNRPRRTTGTKNRRRCFGRGPVARTLDEVLGEPITICVIGVNLAVALEFQRVGGPDNCRAIGHHIGQRKHPFLVRYGHIHPYKAELWQHRQRIGQIILRNLHRDILPVDRVFPEPMGVQAR